MTDLDLLVAGALVSFLAVAGAYVAMRRRANESPVSAYQERTAVTAEARYRAEASARR